MAIHAATTEFRATLGALGITQNRVAKLFGVEARSIRRWRDGDRRVPVGIGILAHLLAAGTVTIDQIERAAGAVSAQTNGGTPPTPLLEPAPEQSEAVASADSGPTLADRVLALTANGCRWPNGDPGHPDFHFCGAPAIGGPYCAAHRALATRSVQGTSTPKSVICAPWLPAKGQLPFKKLQHPSRGALDRPPGLAGGDDFRELLGVLGRAR